LDIHQFNHFCFPLCYSTGMQNVTVCLLLLKVIQREIEYTKVVSFLINFLCFNVMVQNGRWCLCECGLGEWLKQAVDCCAF